MFGVFAESPLVLGIVGIITLCENLLLFFFPPLKVNVSLWSGERIGLIIFSLMPVFDMFLAPKTGFGYLLKMTVFHKKCNLIV